jgi:hypothetical protein
VLHTTTHTHTHTTRSYDVPSTFQEGKGMVGGYNMRTINTTRLCSHTVSQACLRVKPAEVCGVVCGAWRRAAACGATRCARALRRVWQQACMHVGASACETAALRPAPVDARPHHTHAINTQVCLNELIDNLTAAQHHTDAAGSQAAPGSGRVPIAAIVVPLAVVLGERVWRLHSTGGTQQPGGMRCATACACC